ncbi:threonine ammonia-lyase [Methylobrevis pamukkalensis]|uniref:L-threonine dehydratase catabolic TdcB n=1 Tax=Methylobrevis pamukkalensis TaxID=1439726 RepID=A0A1E3H6N1_9HYPH|nr:threonine/serine dehydratase [Methylobrevis pamukkalensis]ODN71446.1 L-threonine dehydratase catabolic TdcB [Methylobrevis pamukkalensis]
MDLPVFADIEAAARRIAAEAVVTPLLRVFDRTDGRLFVKAECLQRTGSFKFRGAFNRLSMIPQDRRAAGVVACSSGNHAQGVAAAAKILGMPAVIVMPSDAPAVKVANTRGYGAEVVLYDRLTDDREAIARAIETERGSTFVHPFDDPGVMAGQGTAGLELCRQLAEIGLVPDAVVVNASGGGLTAGIATALETLAPDCALHTAEPAGFDDHARSIAAGERVGNTARGGSICDALLADRPGIGTFAINSRRVHSGVSVSDEEALDAVAFAARRLKLVAEPGGAVALAAVLTGKIDLAGRTVVVLLTGGNVDDAMLTAALAR